jgi:FkbM family methyltransferase
VADIGANLGYFSLLLSDLVGPEGRVLSFEPNPEMVRLAHKSLFVNGFGGIANLYEMALGGSAGMVELDVRPSEPGGGRISGAATQGNPGSIRMGRFDEIPGALDVEFIKMDVEGFEPEVWEGMTGLFKRRQPLTIFMEFTVSRLGHAKQFLGKILKEGFSLEIISLSGSIDSITPEALLNSPANIDHMIVLRRD